MGGSELRFALLRFGADRAAVGGAVQCRGATATAGRNSFSASSAPLLVEVLCRVTTGHCCWGWPPSGWLWGWDLGVADPVWLADTSSGLGFATAQAQAMTSMLKPSSMIRPFCPAPSSARTKRICCSTVSGRSRVFRTGFARPGLSFRMVWRRAKSGLKL